MSAAQFTLGSWEAIGQNIFVCEHGSLIATCANQDKSDKFNALLIASAPDLLDALQAIAAIEDNMSGGDWEEIEQARDIARAAIAKATGETS